MGSSGDVVLDKELESVLCRSSFSKAYYRSGVLVAVICSAVSLFTISYAMSSGAVISLHTPMFVAAVASLVLFFLSLVYIAVVCALEKRNRRSRSAEGSMSINSVVSNIKLNLIASRSSKGDGGFSTFQTILAYGSIVSLLAAAASSGVMLGNGIAVGSTLSITAAEGKGTTLVVATAPSPLATFMWISVIVFSVSVIMLFVARVFTEESKGNVRILVFPDCKVDRRQVGASDVRETSGNDSCVSEVQEGILSSESVQKEASSLGHIFSMLEGARKIHSILGDCDQRYNQTTVVECVLSAESVEGLHATLAVPK